MEIYFPVDVGQNPSSVSARWTLATKDKRPASTGPVFISLVQRDLKPASVFAWTQLQKPADPALAISLTALPGKNTYTNKKKVEGKIVAWFLHGGNLVCLPLAELRIPPRSVYLKLSDQPGEPGIELTIQSLQLNDPVKETWKFLLQHGNKHLKFPSEPVDAECQSFIARTDAGENDGTSSVARVFLQAYRAGQISIDQMRQQVSRLDAAAKAQKRADQTQALSNIMRSTKALNELVPTGKHKREDGRPDLMLSEKIQTSISPGSRIFGERFVPPPAAPAGPVVRFVVRDTGGEAVPDGSIAHPFRSIAQAYEAARALDSRLVELVVDGGYYDAPVIIDRNTRLFAVTGTRPIIASTLTCTRAVQLEITGFALMEAPSPGALQVLVPGSSVALTDVVIREATRSGIYQRGGEIELRGVTIRETRRERGQMEFGAGMVLDGVQAFLSTVTLSDNESSGIILQGRDAYLGGIDLTFRRNQVSPEFYSELAFNLENLSGAFLISDQAQANLTNLQMHQNEFVSLGVYRDARVTVNSAVIDSSRSIMTNNAEGVERNFGGMGIRARTGGHITMQNFTISDCNLVGVALHPRGEIDLHVGNVCRNPIGVFLSEAYTIDRLSDRVRYFDNDTDLDAATLPVPDIRY